MRTSKRARREAKRLYRICLVDGLLDEQRVRRVVQRAGQMRARNRLAILSCFQRLVKLDWARHTATVESATGLPADLRVTIQAGITRTYGPGLTTSFADVPALIGGTRIKIGSDVYDGTVLDALKSLEAKL